ncbi:VanW family protein [Ruminiclostridium cellobioparum]|uniref:VanW family protein n=1 Tax=Ruminiclostridium cellobioparum TaxID=29355 RepID=UPI00068725F3|nr:VanW family protein [Ruminiclostridium cellobioparum]
MKIPIDNKKSDHISMLIRSRRRTVLFCIAFILVVAVTVNLVSLLNSCRKLSYNYFYDGVYMDGIKLAGLSKAEALRQLEMEFQRNYKQTSIDLLYEDNTWTIPLSSIDFNFDFETAINNAYKLGRSGSWFSRTKTIRQLKKTPVNLVVGAKYDRAKLNKYLTKIKRQIDFSASNSTYDYNCGKIIYTSDVNGKKLDIDTNTKLIEGRLLNRDFSDICLSIEIIKPLITLADVKEIKDVLGVFTTRFSSYNYSRAHNIELAGKKINNYLVLPGEEFSMDDALGPRTPSNGYMQAPIIMRNRFVSGTGGGVCQVATTLYNAILLSYMEVTKRVHHSIPLGYVPPGQDATISEGYIDLKFRNNRDYTICIATEVRDSTVTVKIIGRKKPGESLNAVLRPVIVEEYNPPEPEYVINNSLSNDEVQIRVKERKGFKVVLYRDTYNEQRALINSEVISQDIYKPVRGQLAVSKKTYESLKNN